MLKAIELWLIFRFSATANTVIICGCVRLDLQNVKVAIRILYRPQADKLPQIYTNLGMDYEQRVLDSIVNEVLKAVVVSF